MIDPSGQLDDLVDGYLIYLDGKGREPDLGAVPDDIRREAEIRFEMLRASHGILVGASSSGAGRIAARFGLDRAGEHIDLAGAKVKRVRMSRKLELAEVTQMVQRSGVELSSAQLFRIETAATAPVSQPIVTALVAVLDCSVADLEAADSTDLSVVREFMNSVEFTELIKRWAAEHDSDAEDTGRRVGDQLLAAHYRADGVTRDHLRDILCAILKKLDP